jgi:hypothetical protein
MSTIKRSFATLLLAPIVLGATLPGSAVAAHTRQPITLHALLQSRTVQITGDNFDPGAQVGLALIETHGWKTLYQGTATTEPAVYTCPRGASVMCGQRDPYAGHLSFAITLKQRANPAILAILYRVGNEVGVGRVSRQ